MNAWKELRSFLFDSADTCLNIFLHFLAYADIYLGLVEQCFDIPTLLTRERRLDLTGGIHNSTNSPEQQTNKHTTRAYTYNAKMFLRDVTK